MTEQENIEWKIKHFEGLKKALYWPCWYFLPHGADTDKSRILSQKMWGIIFMDRQLIRNDRSTK